LTLERQTLQTQKIDVEKRMVELLGKLAVMEKELLASQGNNKQALTALAARTQQVATCETNNLALYRHGRELIDQCRDRSATDALLRMERFTGIKRVEIENMLEEYRDRLDAQKIVPDVSLP
jgi:hypothetical protein